MNEFRSGRNIIEPGLSTDLMLKEIAATKVINREEERQLFVRYETADDAEKEAIRTILIRSNLRFVLKVAMYYRNRSGHELSDLLSEGKVGLVMAIDLFDWRTGNKFISFAVWYIRMRLSKYLEQTDLIRLPSHKKLRLNREKKLAAGNPLPDDIAHLGTITTRAIRLESPIDGKPSVMETVSDRTAICPEREYISGKLATSIDKCMDALESNERNLLEMVFGLGNRERMTLKDASWYLGIDKEKVRQVRDSALRKLHGHSLAGSLRDMAISAEII